MIRAQRGAMNRPYRFQSFAAVALLLSISACGAQVETVDPDGSDHVDKESNDTPTTDWLGPNDADASKGALSWWVPKDGVHGAAVQVRVPGSTAANGCVWLASPAANTAPAYAPAPTLIPDCSKLPWEETDTLVNARIPDAWGSALDSPIASFDFDAGSYDVWLSLGDSTPGVPKADGWSGYVEGHLEAEFARAVSLDAIEQSVWVCKAVGPEVSCTEDKN